MATENLTVKFKVDTSEVKQGADEAKNKVKSAAQSMASDVKQSSQSMSNSMGDVKNATQGVESATKSATTAVRQMEGQVTQSAASMGRSLDGVADKIKNISARQAAGVASRGLNIAGNVVGWAANNLAEEGSPAQAGLNVGAAALTGAGSGVMLGAAIGSVVPVIGTAVGAAVGGAVGALAGAAAELWDASKELKKSAEERQKSAQDSLQQHANDLRERERFAGYDRQNQVLLSGLGKTWWENKSTGEKITGEERVFKVQEARQAEVDRISKERDEYIRAHQNDSGDAAVEAATHLSYLDKQLQVAQQHLQALAPVVEAARRSQQETTAAEEKRRAAFEKASAALDERAQAYALKAQKDEVKGEIKEHQGTLSSLQSQLQGVVSRPANSPTDALTRIGGGRGYSAYNNSAANVQMKIENHLRELIKVEQSQLGELNNKLENLTNVVQNNGGATWAQ